MKNIFKIIKSIILIGILIFAIFFVLDMYETNNFKEYKRSVAIQNITNFKKDNNEKYSSQRSYKIESINYNDAMISKEMQLTKNKSYKVTCMVKTQNVETQDNKSGCGAQISIDGKTTRSIALTGTNDWQKLELIFNSKNEDKIAIGLRLGGNNTKCKGTAWFSDIKIEEGNLDNSKDWKFACFIYNSTDVTLNNKNIKLQVTDRDVTDIKNTIKRFEDSCITLSQRKMTAKCDIYSIEKPLTKLSYDNEFGYYVDPADVEQDIKQTINSNNYDHIFIVMRLGDDKYQNDIQVNDWIGLGSMDYYGIGFSNIRLPNDSQSYIYKYNSKINSFPEEVLLHEFLHSLERNAKEYGYEIPALHDYEKYGYKIEQLIGLKRWYTDYMNCNISSNGKKIGLPNNIYTLKPAKQSDFTYSNEIKSKF